MVHVTAVVISHNGSTYLPTLIEALAQQQRPPERIISLDDGSKDSSASYLEEAYGTNHVIRARHRGGFGVSVQAALAEMAPAGKSPTSEYLWLLHDDCAPEPGALKELLHALDNAPSATIAGCKQHDWENERRLVDVGLSASRQAERLTMIEPDEYDQGQYDSRSDVFAVNSAGMLIRRDIWEHLEGLDSAIPGVGDDLDFCWRNRLAGHRVIVAPTAIMRHVVARPGGLNTPSRARRAQVYTRLKFAAWYTVPLLWIGFLCGGLWRIFTGILFKDPGASWRYFLATCGGLFSVGAISRGRSQVRRIRRISPKMIRGLLIPEAEVREYRKAVNESLLGVDDGEDEDGVDPGSNEFEPSGDATDDFASISTARRMWVGAGLIAVGVILAGVSVLASLPLLGATGLTGGALLPVSPTLEGIWQHIENWWISLGLGMPGAVHPFTMVLWVLGLIGFGNATVMVQWLLIFSPAIAGISAWFSLGALSANRWGRALLALLYGAAPSLLVSVNQGRLGAALAHILLPLVFLGVLRAMGLARSRRVLVSGAVPKPGTGGRVSWTAGAASGLLLAALLACAPSLIPLATVAIGLLLAFARSQARTLWWTLAPSFAVFVPFIASTLDRPWVIFADPGLPLEYTKAPGWLYLLGQPVAVAPEGTILGLSWLPEGFPWGVFFAILIGLPLLGIAVVALLLPNQRSRTVRIYWLIVIGALVTAFLVGFMATGLRIDVLVSPFAGPAVSAVWIALMCAGILAFESMSRVEQGQQRVRPVLRGVSIGLTCLMLVSPLASLSVWTAQQLSQTPGVSLVSSSGPRILPATASDRGISSNQTRTLVFTASNDRPTSAQLMRGAGTTLDALNPIVTAQNIDSVFGGLRADDEAQAEVRGTAATIIGQTGADPLGLLVNLGAGFVVVRAGDTTSELLASQIDSVPGLISVGRTDQGWLWRVDSQVGGKDSTDAVSAVRITDSKGTPLNFVPSQAERVNTRLAEGAEGRLLVLSERSSSGWVAKVDGEELPRVEPPDEASWAQGFELPADGGNLEVEYRNPWMFWVALAQIVLLGLTVLLAIPAPARRIQGKSSFQEVS